MPAPNTIAALERLLPIDEHNLEGERATQHDKLYIAAKELALAISRRDAVKKHIKEMDARLSEEFRHREDLTVKACADKVMLHPEMIDSSDELLECEKMVGLWGAMKDAMEQRSYALSGLIQLFLSQHYGEARMERAGLEPTEQRSRY